MDGNEFSLTPPGAAPAVLSNNYCSVTDFKVTDASFYR